MRTRCWSLACITLLNGNAYATAPGPGFEVRAGYTSANDGAQRVVWIAEKAASGEVYVGEEVIVAGADVLDATTNQKCATEYDAGTFGILIKLNAAANEKLRRYSLAHFGEPIAFLIAGKVATLVRLRGPLRGVLQLQLCPSIESESRANELAEQIKSSIPP